jgi:hypothetical protein
LKGKFESVRLLVLCALLIVTFCAILDSLMGGRILFPAQWARESNYKFEFRIVSGLESRAAGPNVTIWFKDFQGANLMQLQSTLEWPVHFQLPHTMSGKELQDGLSVYLDALWPGVAKFVPTSPILRLTWSELVRAANGVPHETVLKEGTQQMTVEWRITR